MVTLLGAALGAVVAHSHSKCLLEQPLKVVFGTEVVAIADFRDGKRCRPQQVAHAAELLGLYGFEHGIAGDCAEA